MRTTKTVETRHRSIDQLTVVLYDELREIAHRHRLSRGDELTLGTTALVHEAYLKLVDQSRAEWNDRAHFLALAAVAMRHIICDRAKARVAIKRGGDQRPITLDEHLTATAVRPDALLELDDALDWLAEIDARLASVVEYRFFGELTHEEIAHVLGVTVRTVERDWKKARALLQQVLVA
jgi:RNA polymerase sigma factor (TIGR02999 family)